MAKRGDGGSEFESGFDPANLPLPSNIEVEQALLGAILVNPAAYATVSGFLRGEHFYEPLHAAIYDVAGEMLVAGKPVTPGTIRTFLPADLMIGDISLPYYLARLAAEATTIINAIDFGRLIVDLAHRRTLVGIGVDLMTDAKMTDRQVSVSPVVEQAASRLFDIQADIAVMRGEETREEVDYHDVVSAAETRMREGRQAVAGVSTGLLNLDAKLPGWMPGDFVVLAGRPGMGKTVLGLAFAVNAARAGHGVVFDSLEMPGQQVRSRLLADGCDRAGHRITYTAVDRRLIRPEDIGPLRHAADELDQLPLVILEGSNRLDAVPGKIKEARRRLARVGKTLDLYVVDYLGLIRPTDRYRGDRVREVGELSVTLKNLARSERLPFIALHQLNRAPEGRKDRRPTMSDLRDSGNLEQDADVVMFVYRESYYHERPGYSDETEEERLDVIDRLGSEGEIIIGKQRQGPVGTVKVFADVARNVIRDLAYLR